MSREQLLTFVVAGAEYGVDILRVQEIRPWSAPMALPRAPSFVKGVINIRGEIVPIADLRERLGLPEQAPTATTAIVVLRIDHAHRTTIRGLVVDAMCDVTNVDLANVQPPPDVGDAAGLAELVHGIAVIDEKLITILDVDRVFPSAPISTHAAA
jgi:purine-binding chemotaxis protein CheW